MKSYGLYRTFKENYVPYFEDGRGRDRYIAYNNAGFFHGYQKYISPSDYKKTGTVFGTKIIHNNRSPSIKAPNFRYHSDGNGRDNYILVNSGGLFYQSKPLISYQLTDFLRKSDNQNYSTRNKRIALSRAEIKYNKLLKDKEKEIIQRLYTNEKKKFMKKKKFDFLDFNSMGSMGEMKKNNSDYNNNININNGVNAYILPKFNCNKKQENLNLTSKHNRTKSFYNEQYNNNNFTSVNMNKSKNKSNLFNNSQKNNKRIFYPNSFDNKKLLLDKVKLKIKD